MRMGQAAALSERKPKQKLIDAEINLIDPYLVVYVTHAEANTQSNISNHLKQLINTVNSDTKIISIQGNTAVGCSPWAGCDLCPRAALCDSPERPSDRATAASDGERDRGLPRRRHDARGRRPSDDRDEDGDDDDEEDGD